MKVRNRGFIRKLVVKTLIEKRRRTRVSILAIILTCILFTTLFTVVSGLIKGMEFQTMKSIGTVNHGSFKDVSVEDIEVLSNDPDIKSYSKRTMLGVMTQGKINAEVSYQDEQGMKWGIFESIKGRLPEGKNEIFADIETLKSLGYKGEVGEEVFISYDIINRLNSEVLEKRKDNFIVSGTYVPSIDSNVGVGQIYVSKDYCNRINLPTKNNEMSVNFSNSWNIEDKLRKVAERNGYSVIDNITDYNSDKSLRIGVNFAYLSNNDDFRFMEFFLPGIALIGIVILAGYLLINNIFEISIVEDTQLYGLLKTMGMTKKQIKRFVHLQGFYQSLPSIVLGNILGIFLGNKIFDKVISTNIFLENVRFGNRSLLMILFLSTLFTLITVYFSCAKPARIAAKISPIEAIKYYENLDIKKSKSSKFSIYRLAARDVFSKRLRFLSIVISISLSAVIINSVITYTGNLDLKKGVSDNIRTDYNIASPGYFVYKYYSSDEELNMSYIQLIKEQSGFINGGAIYSYGSKYLYPKVKIAGKKYSPIVLGIDDYLLQKQSFLQGGYNKSKWNTLNYAYIGENEEQLHKSEFKIGDKVKIAVNGAKKEVEILGKIKRDFSNGLRYVSNVNEDGSYEPKEGRKELQEKYIYLHPETYAELTKDKSIMSYGFDVEDYSDSQFDSLLSSLEDNPDFTYDSRQRQVESFGKFKSMFEFTGYLVSGILFIIAMLNFINIISTDIIRNRVNLAIFETIGMTKKQISFYIVLKSLIYSLCGLLMSIVIGFFINEVVLKKLLENVAWTTYELVLRPLVYVNLFNIVLGIVFSLAFLSIKTKESLIDRIRDLK